MTDEVKVEPAGPTPSSADRELPPIESSYTLLFEDLAALVAMGFMQGYRTGHQRLRLKDPRNDVRSMAHSYAVVLVRKKPWVAEEADNDADPSFSVDQPKIIV